MRFSGHLSPAGTGAVFVGLFKVRVRPWFSCNRAIRTLGQAVCSAGKIQKTILTRGPLGWRTVGVGGGLVRAPG